MFRGLMIIALLMALTACNGGSPTPANPEGSGNASEEPPTASMTLDYAADVQPLFEKYCYRCHDTETQTHEIDVESITGIETLKQEDHLREELIEMLSARRMPPKSMPQPTSAEYETLLTWIKSAKQ